MIARLPALLVLVLVLAACGSGSSAAGPTPSPTPAPEARSGLARDTAPQIGAGDVEAVVAGNNAFALDLHQRLAKPGKNMMTSPYSASTALAMLWAGARGNTASQMAGALRFTLPQAKLHPAFDALDLRLRAPAACPGGCTPFTLRLANTAWAQQDFAFVPAYLDTLAVNYGAGVSLLDFREAPEAARLTINDAVARATEDRVKDLLPRDSIGSGVRLVLTNAVYFKGSWSAEFDAHRTAPGPFRLLDGAEVSAPVMHGDPVARGTAQPAYDAVELGYAGSHFAMTIVVPKAGTFEAFERALDVAGLAAVDAALAAARLHLSMPKFSFTWGTTSLTETLKAMGMTDAFEPEKADLGGIYPDGSPCVTDVLQKTYVAVDEKGTEAAGATAVVSSSGGGEPPPELTVNIDRPFLFLVRDRTSGQILFLGRVVDPR